MAKSKAKPRAEPKAKPVDESKDLKIATVSGIVAGVDRSLALLIADLIDIDRRCTLLSGEDLLVKEERAYFWKLKLSLPKPDDFRPARIQTIAILDKAIERERGPKYTLNPSPDARADSADITKRP